MLALVLIASTAGAAWAVSGAAFTTFDATLGGCLDSPNGINCNHYTAKDKVYMSGGPTAAGLSNGTYFFAVLTPGSQNGGFVDGATGNLSDTTVGGTTGDSGSGDLVATRTFTVTNHEISFYGGTHATGTSPNGRAIIGLAPFDDTDNPGGVYILAVCKVGATSPSECKFDAFKVDTANPPAVAELIVTKDANASYDRTFHWAVQKQVDKTVVKQVGGSATFNYSVSATHDSGTDSNWQLNGTITVTNPNPAGNGSNNASGVDVIDNILSSYNSLTNTKIPDPNASCVVNNGAATALTVAENASINLSYACTYLQAPAASSETNDVMISWLSPNSTTKTAEFTQGFSFETPNLIDECATIDDSFTGPLGTLCNTDVSPTLYSYSRTIPVPQFGCTSYNNTATFTTTDTGATGSKTQTVTVCGPVRTGALTMGFWQNKNGQDIIKTGASTSGVCNSGAWLRQYAPFKDLSSTATCSQVATYVSNIIKAANASGSSMNAMLKAQMLATALDVYFSDPALGGNKIAAPAPIGGVAIDLTQICANIPSCSTFINASSAFGGATSLTISQALAYAASQSNVGGTTWYANVKSIQEQAKDVFDAVNNQVAFAP
jgi:hypothetical protein